MHKKLTYLLSTITVGACLVAGAAAADGGIVDVQTRLNVRTSPSATATVKTRLWDGQVITLHEKSGNWWYVEYAPESYGYVSADYVDPLNLKTATVSTVSSALNVREGASATAAVKDKLTKGESVLLLGTYGDFYKILYRGNLVGYAAKTYLTVGDSSSSVPTTTRAITLQVPSYKQQDKSYASLRLPGSGEPVSTHGCAVVSLAMTESYRTGTTVTPKAVIANQKFTSLGAIYWPSPYTQGGNTLSYMYAQLESGKPVLVHVRKANGSTHFAVVYGFTGGTLTAANFKILDPGSNTRTTLASLYAVYPTLIKTLSY